jgi:hypothetical protein
MSDDQAVPMLFNHCVSAYEAMFDRAEVVLLDGQTEAMVYEGFLTELFKTELHLSVPYYTSVTRALKAMGCISQLQRGGSSSPSKWQLIKDPEIDAFMKHAQKAPGPKAATEDDIKALTQQIGDLNNRLLRIETLLIPKQTPTGLVLHDV